MTTPASTGKNATGTWRSAPQPWITVKQQLIRNRWEELKGKKMTDTGTIETGNIAALDEEGFVALDDLRNDWEDLERMRLDYELLAARIKDKEAAFAARMRAANADGFTIGGVKKVTFKANGTFASKVFAEAEPAIFAAYQIPSTKLDTVALKRDKPELVAKYTPRRWVNNKPKRS